jgi:hypothetical protein
MWGWGFVLFAFLMMLLVIFGCAFSCIDVSRAKDGPLIIANAECRARWASRAYLIVYDMQTGIGAAIAVLGVVWSVFFASTQGKNGVQKQLARHGGGADRQLSSDGE